MTDQERINTYNFKLGLGLVISDLFEDDDSNKSGLVLTPLEDREVVEYSGIVKELQIICKNEGLIFAVSKNFIPYDRTDDSYTTLDNYELILVKELDFLEEAPSQEESRKIGETFKRIQDYLKLEIKGIFFFFYFPENIIIDYDGEGYSRIISEFEIDERRKKI